MRFVAKVGAFYENVESKDSLMDRFHLDRPYFLLPNQFWKHKNHGVVIEALAIARSQNSPMQVVATGNTSDPRSPEHFNQLMNRVREAGCQTDFRVLGVVSYSELAALTRHSIALINPSSLKAGVPQSRRPSRSARPYCFRILPYIENKLQSSASISIQMIRMNCLAE